MNLTMLRTAILFATAFAPACSDSAATKTTPGTSGEAGADGGDTFTSSEQLSVVVPTTGRSLSRPTTVNGNAYLDRTDGRRLVLDLVALEEATEAARR